MFLSGLREEHGVIKQQATTPVLEAAQLFLPQNVPQKPAFSRIFLDCLKNYCSFLGGIFLYGLKKKLTFHPNTKRFVSNLKIRQIEETW